MLHKVRELLNDWNPRNLRAELEAAYTEADSLREDVMLLTLDREACIRQIAQLRADLRSARGLGDAALNALGSPRFGVDLPECDAARPLIAY